METGLKIPSAKDDRPRLPLARRAGPPARPGHHPVPQGHDVRRSTSAAASSTSPPTSPTASACSTGIATAMVDYPIGDLIAERVRAMGVKPFYKRFEHDGVARPEHGHRLQRPRPRRPRARSSSTTAPTRRRRCSSPATSTGRRSSRGGVRWFHSGGIFAALSETTAELIIEGMQAAQGSTARSCRST